MDSHSVFELWPETVVPSFVIRSLRLLWLKLATDTIRLLFSPERTTMRAANIRCSILPISQLVSVFNTSII